MTGKSPILTKLDQLIAGADKEAELLKDRSLKATERAQMLRWTRDQLTQPDSNAAEPIPTQHVSLNMELPAPARPSRKTRSDAGAKRGPKAKPAEAGGHSREQVTGADTVADAGAGMKKYDPHPGSDIGADPGLTSAGLTTAETRLRETDDETVAPDRVRAPAKRDSSERRAADNASAPAAIANETDSPATQSDKWPEIPDACDALKRPARAPEVA